MRVKIELGPKGPNQPHGEKRVGDKVWKALRARVDPGKAKKRDEQNSASEQCGDKGTHKGRFTLFERGRKPGKAIRRRGFNPVERPTRLKGDGHVECPRSPRR